MNPDLIGMTQPLVRIGDMAGAGPQRTRSHG